MKPLIVTLMVVALVAPAVHADSQWSISAGAQWIDKTGRDDFDDGLLEGQFDVDLDAAAGLTFAIRYDLSELWSIEGRSSAAVLDGAVFFREGDAISVLLLDDVLIYPLTLTTQYHFRLDGDWDPYIGAGAGIISIRRAQGLDFDEDYGLVLEAGVDIQLSPRIDLNFDALYIPLETSPEVLSSRGRSSSVDLKPLIYSAGLRYKF